MVPRFGTMVTPTDGECSNMAYLTPTVASHEADTSDAHAASAVSILDTAGSYIKYQEQV